MVMFYIIMSFIVLYAYEKYSRKKLDEMIERYRYPNIYYSNNKK